MCLLIIILTVQYNFRDNYFAMVRIFVYRQSFAPVSTLQYHSPNMNTFFSF